MGGRIHYSKKFVMILMVVLWLWWISCINSNEGQPCKFLYLVLVCSNIQIFSLVLLCLDVLFLKRYLCIIFFYIKPFYFVGCVKDKVLPDRYTPNPFIHLYYVPNDDTTLRTNFNIDNEKHIDL